MTDDNAAETPAGETTTAEPVQPNTAALAAIETAQRRRRGPGRPPKNPPAVDAPSAIEEPHAVAGNSGDAPPTDKPKRKKPSGRKKTRAELAAIVRQYERGEIPVGEMVKRAARVPRPENEPVAGMPAVPVLAGNPERLKAFAGQAERLFAGVARFVARRKGAHWQLGADEAEGLGEATADCAAAIEDLAPTVTPYFEKVIQFGSFAILAGALYEVVDSRLEIDRAIEAGTRPRVMPSGDGAPSSPRLAAV